MATSAPTTAIGYTQAPQYSQLAYDDELTPELQWPQSITVYDQMRKTDSQVASVLRAVTLPVRRTPWRIDPNGARPEVVELVADDLGLPIVGQAPRTPPRQKDRFSWSEHLRLALLMLPMGASYFEQVYRIEDDASRAHLRKLEWRPMKTIDDIQVAQDGGLVSIKQCWTQTNTSPKPIPVSRLVAYVHEREGGNWLGSSILRSAYKNWLLKDRLLRVQAQTIERNGMGIPVYEAAETEASLTAGLNMAKSLRAGEAAGAATPYGAKLRLMGVEGTLPDADPAIKYHDESIARAVLAHFLNLGTQTGSWALGTTFVDFFTMSLQTLAYQIADVANKHIIEDLVDVNFGESEPAPRLVFDEIGSRQQATAQAIKLLVDAGLITPDQVLDETLRQQYGLPPADPATATPPPAQVAPSRAPEPEPVPGEGSVAAGAAVVAHGTHNQLDHGRRMARGRDLLATDSLDVGALAAIVRVGDARRGAGGYDDRGPDDALASIARQQGFDGPPKVVSRQQLDKRIAAGDREMFRRVAGFGDVSAADAAEQFRSGSAYYGRGEWANGIHATTNGERVAKYGSPEGALRMALRADARTVTIEQLRKIRQDRQDHTNWPKDDIQLFQDLGRLAAALGYDAIEPDDDPRSPWILLNRTAVSVEKADPRRTVKAAVQYGLPPADPATAKPAPTQGEPSRAPEPEPVPGEGSVAASAGGPEVVAEQAPELVVAHGTHNQKDHGRRLPKSLDGDSPFAGFTRPQLQKAARRRGIELEPREDRESIERKLAAHLAGGDSKPDPVEVAPTASPARMTQAQYTSLLADEFVRLSMLRGTSEQDARKQAGPNPSIDDLKERNTVLRAKLRQKGVDYRTEEQKRTDDAEKNKLLDEVERLANEAGHDGAAKRAGASKMSKRELAAFVADANEFQRRRKAKQDAEGKGSSAVAAFKAAEDKSRATPRQVGYIKGLLRERGLSEGGAPGPTASEDIRKLSNAEARAYINRLLRGDY